MGGTMVERYLFEISNAVDINIYMLVAAGLMVLMFLIWLIYYQFIALGTQSRALRRLCKCILGFEGVKGELIDELNEVKKTRAIISAWRAFLTAYATARRVSFRDYFTPARILDVPSRRQSAMAFKWLNFVLGTAASIIGAVFIAEKNRLSVYEAIWSRLLNPMYLLLGFTLFICLLYLLIDSSAYARASYRLEKFCALSELVFPREKRENYDALVIKLEQQQNQLSAMDAKLDALDAKLENLFSPPSGQATKELGEEYIDIANKSLETASMNEDINDESSMP